MTRPPGFSARLKLTLSYVAFLMLSGVALLAVVWGFLLRYVPQDAALIYEIFMPGRDDLVRAFLPAAAWALVFLLVVAVVGGWLLAGRMLAPLAKITAVARAAGAGDLGARVRLEGPGDEFRELADSFDAMLAQLQANVGEHQRFAANASHELRTPLAITRTTLEVARRDPELDPAALIDRLSTVNERAIELTEALLLLSRSGQRSFTPERVDFSLLAEEAIETLLPLAERHGVALEADGPAVFASGSPALLLQLITNLVHNGIVYNLPTAGTVRIETRRGDGVVEVSVSNSGPVLDAELVRTLTEPFQRGATRTRRNSAGVGLGLAIVESIVRVHDGALVLTPQPEGGLRATAWLPAAP
ncbi:ATP-binding protein [Leucobacter chromiireducens]|uniref:histidine kinase n=1 Tax=Leucobacter chromiireducens subsp. chromiireducens TaxID=660067 RepID=A0ABS1SR71_9MICO|nr:sensor histidine kinase [Leucobacter chromiireducens subsp. chromiireducens]